MWGLIRRAVVCRPDVGVCFHLSIYLSTLRQARALLQSHEIEPMLLSSIKAEAMVQVIAAQP